MVSGWEMAGSHSHNTAFMYSGQHCGIVRSWSSLTSSHHCIVTCMYIKLSFLAQSVALPVLIWNKFKHVIPLPKVICSTKSLLPSPSHTSLIPWVPLKPRANESFSLLTLHTTPANAPLLCMQPRLQKGSSEPPSNKSLLLHREWILLPRKIISCIYTYSMLTWIISVLSWFFWPPYTFSSHPRPGPSTLGTPMPIYNI